MRGLTRIRALAGHRASAAQDPEAAHDQLLATLPPWVDPLAGIALDVGANEGDWTAAALAAFPGLRVLAIEPSPAPRELLQRRFGEEAAVTIDPRAVSDTAGTATFHATRASVFGSLLAPVAGLGEMYEVAHGGPTEELEAFEVDTATLDEIVGDRPVSLVKLDVQGAEMEVLRGGRRTLQRAQALLVEVLFQHHYDGDATFPELHAALTELGFDLIDLGRPVRIDRGPALYGDACYARAAVA